MEHRYEMRSITAAVTVKGRSVSCRFVMRAMDMIFTMPAAKAGLQAP